jgi:hypothetical protein
MRSRILRFQASKACITFGTGRLAGIMSDLGVACPFASACRGGGIGQVVNVSRWTRYVASISEGTRALSGFEERTAFEEAQDRLMLGVAHVGEGLTSFP